LWSTLLRITVDKDLAQVEGVMVAKVEACYVFLLAFVVAMAIKMVGVLLISALLIIPAASARAFATSPERMALIASLMGAASVIFGIIASHIWDVPTGPAIVVSASIMMIGSILISLKK
jgi:zinc transport system permease protein